MKCHFLLVLGVVFFILFTGTVAQSQNQFKASEIRDYNPNDIVFRRFKAELDKHQERTDSLFIYPEGSVVYILNGEPFTDINYVRRVLLQNRDYIETIAKQERDQTGRRVFDIKYKSH